MSWRATAAMGLLLATGAVPASDGAEKFSIRNQISLAVPQPLAELADGAVRHFTADLHLPPPQIEQLDAAPAFRKFCTGAGAEFPDLVVAPRRISRGEFRRCHDNGVKEIAEVAVGYEAVALLAKSDAPPMLVNPELLYRALAREVPDTHEFTPNHALTWKDLDHNLPSLDIRAILTERGTSTRSLFDDKVLQSGCRQVPELRAIFAADTRVGLCTNLRQDGRVTQVATPDAALTELDAQPPGTFALVPARFAGAADKRYQRIAVDGMLPGPESVRNEDYPLSRRLYFYFKIGHMRDRKGYGVAPNLRDLLDRLVAEEAVGPQGYFATQGMVVIGEAERQRQRRAAGALIPLER